MYYTILDKEQRREVREGERWPPEDWLGEEQEEEEGMEEEDDLASHDLPSLEAEKEKLYQILRSYEMDFVGQHNRRILSPDDIVPMANQYKRYVAIERVIGAKAELM